MTRGKLILAAGALVVGVTLGILTSTLTVRAEVPSAAPPDASPFKNVQVLTAVKSKAEMRALMKIQAAALGVKCSHCHVAGKFDLDDKEEKVEAREMLRMVADINGKWFADDEGPMVSCWTCHRGHTEPEFDLPAGLLPSGPDSFEAEQN